MMPSEGASPSLSNQPSESTELSLSQAPSLSALPSEAPTVTPNTATAGRPRKSGPELGTLPIEDPNANTAGRRKHGNKFLRRRIRES